MHYLLGEIYEESIMRFNKSEKSKKIEREIQKKYPQQEIERGIVNNEKGKLLDKIEKKLDQGLPSSAMVLSLDYISQYSQDVVVLIFLGKALTTLSRYDEAISTFNKLRKLLRKTRWDLMYHFLGDVYKKSGDFNNAECFFKRAIEINSDSSMHYVFLGGLYAEQGRFDKAEYLLEKATSFQEDDLDEAYYNLGVVQKAQERYDEAIESLKKALEIDPDYEIAKRALDDIEFVLGVQKFKK
jgi:tetratricopeptide (TPR) repeat protein